jgi:uncharacterized protein YprB with RNaseH-like and TPR domain
MKLSVEEEVKRGLITAKYQYPAYCTTYDKEGNATSYRVVTHNIKDTIELQKLYPRLATYINTYNDEETVKKLGTVKELMNSLGK